MASRYIVGLDIGTGTAKAVIAERKNHALIVRSVIMEPMGGMRRGSVVDPADASRSLSKILGLIKKIARPALRNIYIGIGTPQIRTQQSGGVVAVSRADTEIYQEDVDRVVRASQAVTLGPNRMIVHHIPQEFVIDGAGDIVDPIGLSGSRLEVNSLVVDAFVPHVKDLLRIIELCGGEIVGTVVTPLGGARATLTKKQKELGVLFVDIGFGTTGICAYEEGRLIGTSIFPVGSANITNDIAIGLKIPVDVAEKIKIEYGTALARSVHSKESVEMNKFLESETGVVSKRFVAEIIESRLAEIFEFIHNELKSWGKEKGLVGGLVLAGGGSRIHGISDLAKQELKFASQTAVTTSGEWDVEKSEHTDCFDDPELVSALGLVLWGYDRETRELGEGFSGFNFKKMFRYFIP